VEEITGEIQVVNLGSKLSPGLRDVPETNFGGWKCQSLLLKMAAADRSVFGP